MTLAERLIRYAKNNPDGFVIRLEHGKIKSFKPSRYKRYMVSKTDNNTIRKIKTSFRNSDYTGYASGYVDKKTNKIYIDKNIFTPKLDKAKKLGLRHNQLSILDLMENEEIRLQKKKGEYRQRKKKQKEKALKKYKQIRKKDVVIKKNGKWYNTLTKRYVSESYAKRINRHFQLNPESTLHRATGHGKYKRDRPISEHALDVKDLLYSQGNQFISTKDITGKNIKYSPIYDSLITDDELTNLKELDYKIDNKIRVELYRLSRDRQKIFHIITWKVNQRMVHPWSVNIWETKAMPLYNKIARELKKIAKRYNLGSTQNLYGQMSMYFYSDVDGFEHGKSFGFVMPNTSGFKIMKDDFKEIFDWLRNKLEIDSYHNIAVIEISFYLWNNKHFASKLAYTKAKYRLGVKI